MRDSCRPSKLEPGLAATYSTPRSLRTCVMRSEPGRTTARAVAGGLILPESRASCSGTGAGAPAAVGAAPGRPAPAPWASDISAFVTSAAAPAAALAAAPLRKPRRLTEAFLVFIVDLNMNLSGESEGGHRGASPYNLSRHGRFYGSKKHDPSRISWRSIFAILRGNRAT